MFNSTLSIFQWYLGSHFKLTQSMQMNFTFTENVYMYMYIVFSCNVKVSTKKTKNPRHILLKRTETNIALTTIKGISYHVQSYIVTVFHHLLYMNQVLEGDCYLYSRRIEQFFWYSKYNKMNCELMLTYDTPPPHICSMCIKTNYVGKQGVGI